MQIIFRQGINKNNQRTFLVVLVALLVSLTRSQNCSVFALETSFTRCLITLDLCSQNPSAGSAQAPSPFYRFSSCQLTHCTTLGVNSQCRNPVIIDLDEQNCFKSCCRLKQFDLEQCEANNIQLKQKAQTADSYLAITLGICAIGLLLAALCFIATRLRCFSKKEELPPEPQLPVWKKSPYRDHKCVTCDQYGAEVETICRHNFHIQCMKAGSKEGELSGICFSCKATSRKLRLWCNECHERYITINLSQILTTEQLQVYYNQSKILHSDCERDLMSGKTDVRLTSTASNE